MNLLVASQIFAGDATTIILNDGSVLNGEIISINSGSYSIQTENMGLININKSRISTINFGKPSDSERTSGNAKSLIMEKASDL